MSRFPKIFEQHSPGQTSKAAEGLPWKAALAKADERSRALLDELHKRLEDSNGAVRVVMTPAGPKLHIDPAWGMDNGEAIVDITALVYTTGASAVSQHLLPAMDNIK